MNDRAVPVKLLALSALMLVAACSGAAKKSITSAATGSVATTAASAAPVAAQPANASDGARIFNANCSSCHGTTGKGIPGEFPPLAGNPVVLGDPSKVIHIVKYGLEGRIVVAGSTYRGEMPDWKGSLSDASIASVVTYIRSAWGNSVSAVSTADVTAVAKGSSRSEGESGDSRSEH